MRRTILVVIRLPSRTLACAQSRRRREQIALSHCLRENVTRRGRCRIKHRRVTDKPRGCRPDLFGAHRKEMLQCLEAQLDRTALELLVEFRARYPERYSLRNLSALQRRVKVWRREAVNRLMCEIKDMTQSVVAAAAAES
jgi:hypothetical protein